MGGFIVGLNARESARFSFLLGLPAIFLSGVFEMYELVEGEISSFEYFNLFLGILSAFIFGYLSIEFFLFYLKKFGTHVFVIYRIIIGISIILL